MGFSLPVQVAVLCDAMGCFYFELCCFVARMLHFLACALLFLAKVTLFCRFLLGVGFLFYIMRHISDMA